MTYTIENKHLNILLIIAGVFFGLIMGVQFLGDGEWVYKSIKVLIMFTGMCAVFYLLEELNAIKLTQTGIHLAFSKEIPYKDIISYEEKSRIISANGRTISRRVLEVTTATGTKNIPLHTDKQILIDAIEAGKSGDGATLLSLLQGGSHNTITVTSTMVHFSYALVVSMIPLLITAVIPNKPPQTFTTNLLEVEKGARKALVQENYQEAYSITKNYLTMYSATTEEECGLYEMLALAERNLGITERFPKPKLCK